MISRIRARRTTLSLILGAATLGSALLVGCSDNKPAAPPPMQAMPVTVLEVQPQKRADIHRSHGANRRRSRNRGARPRRRHSVKRLYQEGETVKAGQPLFQIDRSSYEIALAEARAKADQTARETEAPESLIESKAISQKEYDDATSTTPSPRRHCARPN
jgi:membrane fusion protein (multidrug efflux system)